MATHSSVLAWRIPGTEESSGLQSMGSQKSQTQLNNSLLEMALVTCAGSEGLMRTPECPFSPPHPDLLCDHLYQLPELRKV